MLNEKELRILTHLREDSRQSMTEISRKTDIPVSTVFDKLRKLEGTLNIRHISLVDFSKLGFNIRAAFFIKTNKREELKDFLNNHKNINTIHRINNHYDYFVEAVFRDIGGFYIFKEDIEGFGIEKMDCHFIDEDVKREGMLMREFP